MTDVMWIIIEILVNIYEGFIYSYFMLKFLSPKHTTNVRLYYLLSGGTLAALITALNYITTFEGIASVLYVLELFVFAVIMLNGNIIKKLLASVIPLLTTALITTVCFSFFTAINDMSIEEMVVDKSYIRLVFLITVQALHYVFFKIELRILSTSNDKFDLPDWTAVIAVATSSIIMAALLRSMARYGIDDHQRVYINSAILILLLLNILIYYLMGALIKKNAMQRELEVLKLKDHYHNQYLDNANLQYESMKKIRHDLKNTLSATYQLLNDGDIDKAKSLISQNEALLQHAETYIATNNSIVNAVINSKFGAASAMGIGVSCLSVGDFDGIEDIDLCNLLSNTLENAITACLTDTAEQKQIAVDIYSDSDAYTFTIKNSIAKSVLESNPDLKTTKRQKSEHGYGTQIIKEIADKYSGRCDFYEQEDMFCCKIILQSSTKRPS